MESKEDVGEELYPTDGSINSKDYLELLKELDVGIKTDLSPVDDKKLKLKVIALYNIGCNPIMNPSCLRGRKVKEFSDEIRKLIILSPEELKGLFNEACQNTIFSQGSDYSSYKISPLYSA